MAIKGIQRLTESFADTHIMYRERLRNVTELVVRALVMNQLTLPRDTVCEQRLTNECSEGGVLCKAEVVPGKVPVDAQPLSLLLV